MKQVLFSIFCTTLLVVAGCGPVIIEPLDADGGGGSGGGGGGGGGAGEPGGTVSLALSSASGFEAASASAIFIKAITGEASGSGNPSGPGLDECVKNETGTGSTGGDVEVDYFDVGDTVTLSAGGDSIDLAKSDANGIISYAPSQGTVEATRVSPGSDYDVALSGSSDVDAQTWSGVLSMPDIPDVTSPDMSAPVSVSAGSELALEWTTAGTGELFVFIGGANASYTCRVDDDGSFAIPASVIDDIDDIGSISIGGSIIGSQDMAGRTVSLVGTASVGGSYQK